MSLPKFQLTRIMSDGTEEEPQIFPVEQMPWEEVSMDRRGFLGAGLTIVAVLNSKKIFGGTKTAPPPIGNLKAHDSQIFSLHFSKDGKTLLSEAKGEIKLWSASDKKLRAKIKCNETVKGIAVSPDNQTFALYIPEQIEIRSLKNGSVIERLKLPAGKKNPIQIAFIADGTLLLTFLGKSISILSHKNSTWENEINFPDSLQNFTKALTCSPDGKMIIALEVPAFQELKTSLRIYSGVNGKLISVLEEYKGYAEGSQLLISADSKRLFFEYAGAYVEVWDLESLTKQFSYKIGAGGQFMFSTDPKGEKIFSASYGSGFEVLIWQAPSVSKNQLKILNLLVVPDFEPLKEPIVTLCALQHSASNITSLASSPTGTIVARGSADGSIQISDWSKNECLGFLFDPKINEGDGVSYNVFDIRTGLTRSYTLPCGSPVPAGAVCTCNCVAGTKPTPRPTYETTGSVCSCVPVCTCMAV